MIPRTLPKQDIQSLRIFMTVADCRGITAAQDRLNMSQSLISTRLSDLEYRLGFILCKRGRSGFALTKEGEAVYQSCLGLFESVDLFAKKMNAIKNPVQIHLNMAVASNLPEQFINSFPDVLAKMYQQHAGLSMNLDLKSAHEIELAVESGSVDIGIVPSSVFIRDLIYEKVLMVEQALFCHKNHPLLKQKITLDSLQSAAWVRNTQELKEFPLEIGPVSAEVNSEATALSFILSGTHIGYLSVGFAQKWEDRGLIQMLLPKQTNFSVEYYLIHKKQGHKQIQEWADALKSHMQLVASN